MGVDGFQVPELEEEWKMGCRNSPMWESEGDVWSEEESVSSCRIGSWQKAALSCHVALDLLCQEMNGTWQWVWLPRGLLLRHKCSPLFSPWTGRDSKGYRDVVRGK